ncbi:hypothetical protein COO60DRAFT_588239 [Scenedesmus sp. NREL 46B-D3]|nr:hypothetical protein COO60DRAFT_588239 [Scenedesmus sp. NREL 46B-D3]
MPEACDELVSPGYAGDVRLSQDVLTEVLRLLPQHERLQHAPLVCKLLCAAAYKATADASINLAAAAAPDGSFASFSAWLGRGGAACIQTLLIRRNTKAVYVLPNVPQPSVQLPWADLAALRSLHLHGVELQPLVLQAQLGGLTSLTLTRVANTSCLLQHLPTAMRQLAVRSDGRHRSTINSSSGSSWQQQAAWKAVGQLRHLTSLLLDRCCVTDASLRLFTALQQLQRLQLWHNRLTNPWQALARLTSLSHLDLLSSDPLRIGSSSLGSSSSGWLGLRKLQELRCGSHVLLEDPGSPACLALPPNLLKLEGCGWQFASPAAAQVLLECTLPVLPLQQLKLLCCEFPAGLQPGAFAALGRLAGLTSLNLSGCMMPHGACSSEGLFKAGAMPRLQELLLHALSYSPVDGSHPAVSPAHAAPAEGCLAGLSAACPALQRLDIRGILAVELGGLTALTRLQHLSKVEVDMQWYGVLDEAVAAALEQLRNKAAAAGPTAAPASRIAAAAAGLDTAVGGSRPA